EAVSKTGHKDADISSLRTGERAVLLTFCLDDLSNDESGASYPSSLTAHIHVYLPHLSSEAVLGVGYELHPIQTSLSFVSDSHHQPSLLFLTQCGEEKDLLGEHFIYP
ncbi:hypothetical protein STEG23_033192, partial [Scotinomys teguina]